MNSILYKGKIPFILLAVLLSVGHFVFLMIYFEPSISTPDAQGYFAQAKLIAKEGKTYLEPESIIQYIGPHWHHSGDNHYFTTFPPGFPAILAIVYKIFGPKASLLVNPLMASLSLLGLFLLCRVWIGKGWGLLALGLMAVNPFANEHALFGDSHTAVVFFLIWALLFLSQWTKTDSAWWAFATGFFVGIIPTIRYPELLFCLAFGIFLLFHRKSGKISRHSLLAGVIGAAVPIGALCIRNSMAFGAFWRTGYGLSNGSAHFGWNYFTNHSLIYLQKLIFEGGGLIFILGVIGIVFLFASRDMHTQGVLFAMLVVPITLLYMSYYWKPDPQSMRFLLPTFYVYTIAGIWLLRMVTNNRYCLSLAGSVVLLLITIVWGLPQSLLLMQHQKDHNAVLVEITGMIEEHVEPGSIIITNEGIDQHLDFIGYWRLIDISILNYPEAKPMGRFAPGQDIPGRKAIRDVEARLKYADLRGEELFRAFLQDAWQWATEKHKVYFLAREKQVLRCEVQLSQGDELVMIEEIKLPEAKRDNLGLLGGFRPPTKQVKKSMGPRGPMGPNQIFDFALNGEPLFLVEWTRKSQ